MYFFNLVIAINYFILSNLSPMNTETSHEYTAIFASDSKFISVPILIFSQERRGGIYRNPIFGVKIKNIMADNKLMKGCIYEIDLDDVDLTTMKLNTELTVYILNSNEYVIDELNWVFLLAKEICSDGFVLERYTIPKTAKHITIKYQIRFADSKFGPPTTVNLISNKFDR